MKKESLNPQLIPATLADKPIIINLARFYVYDLSRYSGDEPGWEFPENGLYEAQDKYFNYDNYWNEPGHYPFLIRVKDELAGFVLINNKGSSKNVDWLMAEFYIVVRFQGKGIGREVAIKLIDQFSGAWEARQLPGNIPAVKFWKSLLQDYTQGQYSEDRIISPSPTPHEMIVLKFQSQNT